MSQQENQDLEEHNFIREFTQKHYYNLGAYDFAPFWTTVKQIQQTLQQVCGTKRQSAHISLNLIDIIFNGCKENQKEVNEHYHDQLAYSTIDFTESDATYFDPFWLEKEYYHYIMKQPRVSIKEHANQFYGDVFKYAALKTYIDLTEPFTKHPNQQHDDPMLKVMSNIELTQNINLKNYTVHLQIDFDLDIWKDVTE